MPYPVQPCSALPASSFSAPPYSAQPATPYPVQPYSAQPYQQQGQVIFAADTRPTSGTAVASMVLGILGLVSSCCTFGIFSVLAVILGHVGLHETKKGTHKGQGMAIAGLVMGYVIVGPAIAFSIWAVFAGGLSATTGHA